jgi:NMT1/THI5 like
MGFFQWFFFSLIVLIVPGLASGAVLPVRVKIGAASFSSSALSLWLAREQGVFAKRGIEAQTILIRGGPTLVASLVAGDIDVAFTSGVSVLGAAAQGIDVKMLTSISSRVSWKLMAAPQIKKRRICAASDSVFRALSAVPGCIPCWRWSNSDWNPSGTTSRFSPSATLSPWLMRWKQEGSTPWF